MKFTDLWVLCSVGLLLGPLVSCLAEVEGDEAGECDDGVDNDQNGSVDCADEGCALATLCTDGDNDTGDDDTGDDDTGDDDTGDDDSGDDDSGDDDSAADDDDDDDDDDSSPDADQDGDGFTEDCDDTNPNVFPGAAELCDGLDNDCNNVVDDGALDAIDWYLDDDGDGYGDPAEEVFSCDAPPGYVGNSADCDDEDARFNPGAIEFDCEDANDYNCDGSVGWADADSDGFAACADCDDSDPAVNEDALEICNAVDDDCDGLTDEDDPDLSDGSVFYGDSDGDGFGGQQYQVTSCSAPAGYVANSLDCNDLNPATNPGAFEICDDEDNDCDTSIDEGVGLSWYADADGDGYGNVNSTVSACSAPQGYTANATDCDDTSPATSPSAYEICDGIDNNCDGSIDEAGALNPGTFYADTDGDGYGNAAMIATACNAPPGYVADATDCDDNSTSISPGAAEICNGLDDDCDGTVDGANAADSSLWFVDLDGDGFGNAATTQTACTAPTGFVSNDTDCNDLNSAISPAGTEVCDSSNDDEDCDGTADNNDPQGAAGTTLFYPDNDGDGYGDASEPGTAFCDAPSTLTADNSDCDDSPTGAGVNPLATEVYYDGIDSNCDNASDYDADSDGFDSNLYAGTDCDDNDPLSTTTATDADCDGVLPPADCDNNDPGSTTTATDADCDGVLTAADCDDSNAAIAAVGTGPACPATSCLAVLDADPTAADGAYWISPTGANPNQLYCDMTLDDGGWTLVYHNSGSAIAIHNSGNQGSLSDLSSPSGGSAKLSDGTILALRSQPSSTLIGYRVTSNNITNRYFAPSNCIYEHYSNSDNTCRRYTASYNATNPSYVQCVNWGGNSGGLDAWYDCNGGGYTNVFNTHRGYSETSGITTNSNGSTSGSSSTTYSNDVLMWVR